MGYICATIRAWSAAPDSVVRRNFLRAAMYPVNFLISYGLASYANVHRGALDNPMFYSAALILESSSGLLNVLVYSWQSWYARQAIVRDSHGGASASPTL